MTMAQFLTSLRAAHQDGCLTTNCRDAGCSVNLVAIRQDALAIIHGESYRARHGDATKKIADRIIFANLSRRVVAVIELKGGNSIRKRQIRDAVEQIRMGVQIVENLLTGRKVDKLCLFLAYSGRMSTQDANYLRNNKVQFRGVPVTVVRVDCGSSLTAITDRYGYLIP